MIGGHKLSKLIREHEQIEETWREQAYGYWRDFIRNSRDKGFTIRFNDKAKTIEMVKEGTAVVSLHFRKEMLKEDSDIRFSLELVDKYLFEELEKGKEVRYNGKTWKIQSISGNWVRIETLPGEGKWKNIKVHKDVLLKEYAKPFSNIGKDTSTTKTSYGGDDDMPAKSAGPRTTKKMPLWYRLLWAAIAVGEDLIYEEVNIPERNKIKGLCVKYKSGRMTPRDDRDLQDWKRKYWSGLYPKLTKEFPQIT